MTAPRLGIGVISAGRAGASLGAALRREGHAITGVHAVSDASRGRAAAMLPGIPLLEVEEIIRRSELVLLAVPDDQLPRLAGGIAAAGHVPGGQVFVHTSGLHGAGVLDPLVAVGSGAIALHPAMTFTGTPADLPRLAGARFAVTTTEDLRPVAHALVTELDGIPVDIAETDRPRYHAALAHGANHLVVLVDQARDLLARIGVEDPGGYLRPLLLAALEESLTRGGAALTGPVRRGDIATVAAHLQALDAAQETAPTSVAQDTADAYRVLARAAIGIAGLPDADAARIRDLLDPPDGRTTP
ncbi:MAG: DUF2520 domain-containing protein [Brachybacterium sp.]|nr:DUF2520 domain-containing protein [Brachybacterium sp.]